MDVHPIETPARRMPSRLILTAIVIGAALLVIALVIVAGGQTVSAAGSASLLTLMPAAFLAGMLSFLSPCTLPILPAYFAFSVRAKQQNVVVMTVAFFLGLATTLTVLGASATALGSLLLDNLRELTVIGGLVIIAFGVMSVLGKGFAGPQLQDRPDVTIAGSYVYGATFALGWTACVGPILGAILTLLATQGLAVLQGGLLAFIFALGLGMPLILVASFFSRLGHGTPVWQLVKGRGFTVQFGPWTFDLHTTSIISGLLLILVGYLLASGQMTLITRLAAGSDASTWVIEMEEMLRGWFGLR
ncbi:MAG: cytochrome c biogenesis CcdA family protein [Anaerolineales bacterium]